MKQLGFLALALMASLLVACPSEGDELCEDGEARCAGNDIIQYCYGDEWGEEEQCRAQDVGGGQTIPTYCYPDQGVCAP